MKLAYRTFEPTGTGPDAVVLHGEGGVPTDHLVATVRAAGATGQVVVPFGDYATTPSGMEVGGPCWYRVLPAGTGTDPLTLTRAVVQVADLLDDVGLDRPVLMGWGQGAVVAVGAGLLPAASTGPVVAVDPPSGQIGFLPDGVVAAGAGTGRPGRSPSVLLVATRAAARSGVEGDGDGLVRHGVPVEVRVVPGQGGGGAGQDREGAEDAGAIATVVAEWLGSVPVGEGRAG